MNVYIGNCLNIPIPIPENHDIENDYKMRNALLGWIVIHYLGNQTELTLYDANNSLHNILHCRIAASNLNMNYVIMFNVSVTTINLDFFKSTTSLHCVTEFTECKNAIELSETSFKMFLKNVTKEHGTPICMTDSSDLSPSEFKFITVIDCYNGRNYNTLCFNHEETDENVICERHHVPQITRSKARWSGLQNEPKYWINASHLNMKYVIISNVSVTTILDFLKTTKSFHCITEFTECTHIIESSETSFKNYLKTLGSYDILAYISNKSMCMTDFSDIYPSEFKFTNVIDGYKEDSCNTLCLNNDEKDEGVYCRMHSIVPNLKTLCCSKTNQSVENSLLHKYSYSYSRGVLTPSKVKKNDQRETTVPDHSFDKLNIPLKHNQLIHCYRETQIHSECTEAPIATINTVAVDSAEDNAKQSIVDLKHKYVYTGNQNSCFNTKIKICNQTKTKRSHGKESFICDRKIVVDDIKTKCSHEKESFTSNLKIVVDDIKTRHSHGKGKVSFTCDDKSYVDDIRVLTWLPVDQLPVPEVDITVALLFDPLDSIFQQMARGDTPGPEITMRYELLRLCTLRNYPKSNKPYIIRLAGAGFYYAAEGDEVVCYCCGIRKSLWTANDIPLVIHRRESPSCSFLIRNSQVNIRVLEPEGPSTDRFAFIEDPAESSAVNSRSSNQFESSINDTFSSNDHVSQGISTGNSAITRHRSRGNFSRITTGNTNSTRTRAPAGNFVCSNNQTQIGTTTSHHSSTPPDVDTATPKHPTYAVKSVRIASFERWPLTTGQTPEVMADAGYYYAGMEDAVRCFHCGIGLRHWTPDDNPYIEHARWSRNCVYLKLFKGEEFISLVHLAMQFTDDNEEQTGATGGAAASQIPVDEINKILLTDAGQSVLEMGYQPKTIKQAIEEILKDSGKPGISSSTIMAKVLEMEERRSLEELAKEVGHLEIKSQGSNEQTKTQNVPSQTDKNTKKTQIADNSSGKQAVPLRKDPKAIKAENDKMVEQTLCKVCMNNTVCIVFLPCGHLVTCAECAPAMRKCPICRTLVKGTVKAFMS